MRKWLQLRLTQRTVGDKGEKVEICKTELEASALARVLEDELPLKTLM